MTTTGTHANSNSPWHMNWKRRILSLLVGVLPDGMFIWLVAHLHRRVEPEMRPITQRCDPNGIAIDVGAWYGPWSYWLSRRVRSVETFDPNPEVTAKIAGHLGPNVVIHSEAVSDRIGKETLFLSGGGKGLEAQSSLVASNHLTPSIDVNVVRLDSFDLKNIRLLKIDVEGYEYHVLKGGESLILRDHPVLVVELEDQFGDIFPSVELINQWGYVGKIFVEQEWIDFEVNPFIRDQRVFLSRSTMRGYLAAAAKKGYGYYNNVVFVHPESTWSPWPNSPMSR